MEDSYVVIYHGPRRGGKTASMTAEACVDLVNGKKVFSNYPIDFYYPDENGIFYHYASQPLVYEELEAIDSPETQEKYSGSSVYWDESAISLNNRNWQAPRNKIMGMMIILIGKLEMTFGFTCQFLGGLDGNVKQQADAIVFCCDLSFKYRNLQRGTTISQSYQDISGRFTGEMYEYSEMVYRRTFHAKMFWNVYDTKKTFPIIEEKRTFAQVRDRVLHGENMELDELQRGEGQDGDLIQNQMALNATLDELIAKEQFRIEQPILYRRAMSAGFRGRPADMSYMLDGMGCTKSANNVWRLESLVLV